MDTCPASPPGYFYRGDCKLLCRPAQWYDVLIFFLGNYVAHIPTVVSRPGQSLAGSILFPILALLFPGTGIAKAMGAIGSRAIFAPTELQMAARAGALYMVAPLKLLNWPLWSHHASEDENGGGGVAQPGDEEQPEAQGAGREENGSRENEDDSLEPPDGKES
jgi:hypothetical protein